MTDLPDMARAVLDDFYAVLDDPDAAEIAKLQAVTEAVAGIDGYDAGGRITDTVSNYAISTGLDADKVQRAIVGGREHAQLAREYRDQRPALKPNGAIHQRRDGGLHEKPSAKGKPDPFDWRKGAAHGKGIRMMVFNPVTFLVRDLIPNEGITLICAKPKVGKSWLVLDIAIGATMERFVLGDIKPVQGAVLYLALEDSLRRIQARMTKLLPTFSGEWPETLTFATAWRRVDQGGLDDIREWAAETRASGKPIAFIAIDVLKMVRPPSKAGQPPYEADYEAIKGLHQLAIELGVPIVVVHHTRKAAAEDLIDKVSGTAGLTGAVDTIIVIERDNQGIVFDVRGRDIEANTLAVQFSKETCRWTILGPAGDRKASDTQAKILEALRQADGPLGPKKVTEVTGVTEDNAKQSLSRMARNGEIIRVGRGEYTLPD
jgi:hypothetical protein